VENINSQEKEKRKATSRPTSAGKGGQPFSCGENMIKIYTKGKKERKNWKRITQGRCQAEIEGGEKKKKRAHVPRKKKRDGTRGVFGFERKSDSVGSSRKEKHFCQFLRKKGREGRRGRPPLRNLAQEKENPYMGKKKTST